MKNYVKKGVVFGNGFLGNRIAGELGFELPDMNVLDTEKVQKYLEENQPSVVINGVGETGRPNIDWCEQHREQTFLANTAAPIILSASCAEKGIYFIHLGTGGFYSSSEESPADEEMTPNAVNNVYLESKLRAEETLKALHGLQLRIHTPLDDRPGERNLVDKLLKYPKLLGERASMTTVPYLIEIIRHFIENPRDGIYNAVHPGTISPAEVMKIYQEVVDPDHTFTTISPAELAGLAKASRPRAVLSTEKLADEGVVLPDIHTAVRESLVNYRKHQLS
jgi:dTDP-4-dehydrorhamnose reductase